MVKLTASETFHPYAMENSVAPIFNSGMVTPRRKQFRRTFIREWRKHRDLTLEQLADRLDMTASHLSMLERGGRSYTQETLEAIAEALSTDTASLLMRDPTQEDAIWSIWEHASKVDRRKITEIAKTITGKTGTGA